MHHLHVYSHTLPKVKPDVYTSIMYIYMICNYNVNICIIKPDVQQFLTSLLLCY